MSTHRTIRLFVAWNGILQPYYSLRRTQATNGLLTFMHSVDVWHKKGRTFAHQRWQHFKDHKKRWTQSFCQCFTVPQVTQITFTFSNLILNLNLNICLSPMIEWQASREKEKCKKNLNLYGCTIHLLFESYLKLKKIAKIFKKNKSGWIAEYDLPFIFASFATQY